MRVFKDLELVEYLGSGMPRILKAYPRTAYTFSTHFIRTAFPISKEALALEKEVAGEQPGAKASGKKAGRSSPKSSPKTEERIIALIRQENSISTERLGEILGISKRAVLKQIDKLKKAGRLRRIGPTKGGHWEIKKGDSK